MGAGIMEVRLIGAKGLKRTDFFDKIDPYVVIRFRNEEHRSSTAEGEGSRPVWNEEFRFGVDYPYSEGDDDDYKLVLQIYDRDTFTADDYLGITTIYLKEMLELGMENGKAELGIQSYRVVLDDGSYHGEIKLGVTFAVKRVRRISENTRERRTNTNSISAAKRKKIGDVSVRQISENPANFE